MCAQTARVTTIMSSAVDMEILSSETAALAELDRELGLLLKSEIPEQTRSDLTVARASLAAEREHCRAELEQELSATRESPKLD